MAGRERAKAEAARRDLDARAALRLRARPDPEGASTPQPVDPDIDRAERGVEQHDVGARRAHRRPIHVGPPLPAQQAREAVGVGRDEQALRELQHLPTVRFAADGERIAAAEHAEIGQRLKRSAVEPHVEHRALVPEPDRPGRQRRQRHAHRGRRDERLLSSTLAPVSRQTDTAPGQGD